MAGGEAYGGHREISAQVHSVIAAAERAAEAIREDAEAQALIYLSDAQERAHRLTAERLQLVGELTDDLLAHAGAVREQSATLLATLERAIAVAEARLAETPAHAPAAGARGAGSRGAAAGDADGRRRRDARSDRDDDRRGLRRRAGADPRPGPRAGLRPPPPALPSAG